MFQSIGSKIKILAWIIFVFGILFSVIVAICCLVLPLNLDIAVREIAILILGPLAFGVLSYIIYGLGDLIERTYNIEKLLSSIENKVIELSKEKSNYNITEHLRNNQKLNKIK